MDKWLHFNSINIIKFKSNVPVIKNTTGNSLVDIRVIRAIQHKLFILAYGTILQIPMQ